MKYSLFVAAFLCCGILASGALGQEAAPQAPPSTTTTEAAALERLAARLAERRAALDARRQALAREQELLSAVDQPASEADLARWRERHATANRLEADVETLRALIGVLTPEALQAVSLPEADAGPVLTPDPGLSRTSIEVNLRPAPQAPPSAVLKAGTLVVRLATDANGGWALVATSHGIGFVPASQLQREP